MSMPPVLGRKLRIGRRNGSVSARNRFQTERTKSLRMLTTPKAISQERIAPAMMTQVVEIEDHHHDVEDRAHEFSRLRESAVDGGAPRAAHADAVDTDRART